MLDVNLELPAQAGEVAKEAYSDGVKDTIREISKIGVDAVKTLRLALAPLQFSAMLQDRVALYFKRAALKASSDNRMCPAPCLALPILEKVRYQEDGDLLTEIYVELLSAGFDRSRVGDAHPAFLNIISQLSPDEIRVIDSLAESKPKNFFGWATSDWAKSSKGIVEHLDLHGIKSTDIEWGLVLAPDELLWPMHLQVYIGHLHSLGLLEYVNAAEYTLARGLSYHNECWAVTLTEFGSLFYRACVKGAPVERFAVTPRIAFDFGVITPAYSAGA
ncbi:Abi-alpha family protein [Pseudomonas putida]|uniref:Abi-alpha family protein n=1 Tax=Pseudomonas putida TaxID=303 RepID=UPI000A6E082F|nr:Abi-alpha family protein [Pseudomonas putida]